MAVASLAVDAGFFALAACLYAYVGHLTLRRRVVGPGQLAATLFGVWWFALAGLEALHALRRGLAAGGVVALDLHRTIVGIEVLALSVALWALAYYLFYLLSGSRRVLVPVTVFYAAFYAAALYALAYQTPTAVVVEPWKVGLEYARPLAGPPLAAFMLAILVPHTVGALGYARLYLHAEDPTQRYRIGLVSMAIAVWFGAALLAWLADVNGEAWWQVVNRSIGLGAAAAICLAYRPVGWIRRRFGVRAIDEPSPV